MLNEKISPNDVQVKAQNQQSSSNVGLSRLISKRKQYFEDELKASPPEPPWEKHPGYSRTDQFWRTGAGSQYLKEVIWPYNRYSTEVVRKQYRKAHPEPENWAGWYSE